VTINEERRFALHGRLEAVLGPKDALTLMEHLPPATWVDLVRSSDLETLRIHLQSEMTETRSDLRSEMAELRHELRTDMTELRAELRRDMTELRAELRGDMTELREELHNAMTELRTEIHTDMVQLRSDIHRDIEQRFTRHTWQLISTTIGLQALSLTAIGFMIANMN